MYNWGFVMIKSFVVFDVETTGLDPASDKIIEVGLVRLEDGEITGKYHALVNPKQPLPFKIKKITGIDDKDLESERGFEEIMPEVLEFIGDAAIAGHNINFDMAFLAAARGTPFENLLYDTLDLARMMVPDSTSYRLETLCEKLDIKLKVKHRALEDAMATARLLTVLIEKMQGIDFDVLKQLNVLLGEARSGWSSFVNGLLKEHLKKFPDRKISNVPYWIRVEERPMKKSAAFQKDFGSKTGRVLLDENDVTGYVGVGGPLASVLPGYRHRHQQEDMVRQVARALNEEKYLIMEAGTGVGKSIAYLIPFVLWSLSNRERVVVATHTINLQEQLLNKDIPILREIIDKPFKAVLAKGRQNYICLRRWIAALEGIHLPEEAAFFARVLIWLATTVTGDKSELNISPGEEDYWFTICGEVEGCLGNRCYHQRDCFVNKARREAEEAHLIIVNHSFLFSDIVTENRLLPEYGPLVIDEAHHLDETATKHLGRQLSQSTLNRWLGIAGKSLSKLAEKVPPDDWARWSQNVRSALEIRLETIEALRLFFEILVDLAVKRGNNGEYNRITIRMPFNEDVYDEFLAGGRRCVELIEQLTCEISKCIEMTELWAVSDEAWAGPCGDLRQIVTSGAEINNDFKFVLENEDEDFVYWAEIEFLNKGSWKHCSISAVPIDIGPLLYERLYKNRKNVLMTSATLSVNGNFEHFVKMSGLNYINEDKLICMNSDSPFVYEKQALLCVSRGIPVQGEVADDVYMDELEQAIFKVIEATGGSTLVLFTSHRTLREIYRRLKPSLESLDILLLGHGIDGSRSKILEEFKTSGRAVLFGAFSFWEGIDVPGEALTCVVMVKLPFMSPSVPVIEARLENLARQNRDGFRALSVPKAVIRFKQGFGRLIRSDRDRGCVIILDGRILSKSYGRQFLNSLPIRRHFRGSIEIISQKIKDWFIIGVQK